MVDTLYYQQPCSVCGGFHNQEAETTIHFSPKIIEAYLRKLYGKKFDVETEIEPTIWREVLKYLNQACVEGISQSNLPPTLEQDFYSELKQSNGVFAALKVHSMGNVMATMLTDENGKLKPFRQWKEDVASIASHYMGSWLQTEYNTAVIRAHNAADWLNFERNKDLFPNLRWMPTVSPDPDEVHRRFWERKLTRPINDPFWNKHRPGDRWNCKCSLEATDDPITDIPGETDQDQPQPGLKGNPAKTKQIFDSSHPYFPKSCSSCSFKKNTSFKNWFNNVGGGKNCLSCKYVLNCLPGVQEKAVQHIKAIKSQISQFQGMPIKTKTSLKGEVLILRRSLSDIYEHQYNDAVLMKWLSELNLKKFPKLTFQGWAPNRPYSPNHSKYDPNNPLKQKHPDTDYFRYYTLKIGNHEYWANVKVHKLYGEVIYTIERMKPTDIIKTRKKDST